MPTSKYNYSNKTPAEIALALQPWVEWRHISKGRTHCFTCLKLDKCWFAKANMPMLPQHMFCHCTAVSKSPRIVQAQAKAESVYSKFDPYLFDPDGVYGHKKDVLFRLWGYTVEDSSWLKEEMERQGLEKYISGEYTLNKLDYNGQRINIVIKIPRKDNGEIVSFISGWMVMPNGKIRLVTPYGDR